MATTSIRQAWAKMLTAGLWVLAKIASATSFRK